jgi:hypothetical protein
MEKQLINEITRIKELLLTNQLINESVVPPKVVREIFKDLGEFNFRKLFGFASDADVKVIKTSKNGKAIEQTFEKLIKNVNWNSLAKDIIGNELFGKNFTKILNNEIQKVGKGIKTKEESIKAFDSFLDTYSATKNLEDLKKALISEIDSKLNVAVSKISDTSGVLSQQAQSIFNAFGKTMSSQQAEFLNGIAKKINKLTPTELLQANNELKNIAAGTVQDAITRLSQAKDTIDKAKADKLQKLLDKVVNYLNMSTKATGGVNKKYLLSAIGTLATICIIVGIYVWGKDTFIGKLLGVGGSAIVDKITPDVPDTNTPPEETW